MRFRNLVSRSFYAIFFIVVFINNAMICNTTGAFSKTACLDFNNLTMEESSSYKILNVPYEDMMYDIQFGDAGACLSMLSQYYGKGVSKIEINSIVDADYSGGGGISEEGLIDAAVYDSYSTRDFGYYIEIVSLEEKTYEERWSYIKSSINNGIPLIMISKLYSNFPTHHRVIFGYDEREDVLFLQDPWSLSINPVYQGGKSVMSIKEGSWLDVQWFYNKYKLAIVQPIGVSLSINSGPVTSAGSFVLNCTIDNSFMNNLRDIRLELELPDNYSVIGGDPIIDIADFIGTTTRNWNIACPTPTKNDKISVKAITTDGTTKYGGIDDIFPMHPQPFICNISSNYANDIAPYKTNITIDFDCTGEVTASLHSFSVLPNAGAPAVNTTNTEVIFESPTRIKGLTGPNEPDWLVFCWFKINTIFGSILSPIIAISSSYDTDRDSDEISDYEEDTIYFTDPSTNDTDKDKLTDYEELFVYHTNATNADTDGDRMNDFDEIALGFNPLDPKSNLFRRNLILGLSISLPVIVVLSTSISIYFLIKKRKAKNPIE